MSISDIHSKHGSGSIASILTAPYDLFKQAVYLLGRHGPFSQDTLRKLENGDTDLEQQIKRISEQGADTITVKECFYAGVKVRHAHGPDRKALEQKYGTLGLRSGPR